MIDVKIKRFDDTPLPRYATDGSSCLDCYAPKGGVIYPGQIKQVPLGFAVELPPGWEFQVRPRSGLSTKGIVVVLGTVDSDYRGELALILQNHTPRHSFEWEKDDRLCQLALVPTFKVRWQEVDELSKTTRGGGGFGSTGA